MAGVTQECDKSCITLDSPALSVIRGGYFELGLNSIAEGCVILTSLCTGVRISPPVQVRQSAKHLDREV